MEVLGLRGMTGNPASTLGTHIIGLILPTERPVLLYLHPGVPTPRPGDPLSLRRSTGLHTFTSLLTPALETGSPLVYSDIPGFQPNDTGTRATTASPAHCFPTGISAWTGEL